VKTAPAADGGQEEHSVDELERRLLSQAPEALDQLIDAHIDPVHRLVSLIIGSAGSPEDVEETVADTFTRAWNRAPEFDPARTTLRSWVLMVAKYTALDRRRALVRQRYTAGGEARVIPLDVGPEPAAGTTPEEEAIHHEDAEQLHHALELLPPSDRDLLVRRYFFEEPITDMARELGLTRSAIDNRLWRARQALKEHLAPTKGVQYVGR
jgi:RNA polymerase sigma-70 factor, ECF subfamily